MYSYIQTFQNKEAQDSRLLALMWENVLKLKKKMSAEKITVQLFLTALWWNLSQRLSKRELIFQNRKNTKIAKIALYRSPKLMQIHADKMKIVDLQNQGLQLFVLILLNLTCILSLYTFI